VFGCVDPAPFNTEELMILLYTMLLLFLGVLHLLIRWRVRSLEKKFSRTAAAADKLVLAQTALKEGNSSKTKTALAESAKQQYQLGQLVQKRDILEIRYHGWQGFAEKFGRLVAAVQRWKGRKLPYTMGLLDMGVVLYLVDRFGVGQYLSFDRLSETVATLMTR